jgi:hypothetical protein
MNAQQWNNLTGPDRMTVLEKFDFSDLTRQNYRAQVHQWTHFDWVDLPTTVRRTLEYHA